MFNFDINRGRSRISALLASGLIALSGATFAGAALAQSQPAPAVSAAAEAAPAPVAAAEGAGAKAGGTAIVDNPYGIEALWKGSDAVAKTVLLLLLVMSVGSWYVIIVKLLEQTKIGRQAKKTTSQFWNAGSVQQGAENLEGSSPFRFIAEAGIEATKKHDGLLQHVGFNEWVTLSIQRAIERIQSRLQGGLAFLATVGSTAPFVGLFGTVWGIYHALTAIGVAGQASIDKVAGPVGEALIMTAIGLAVAVPAVLGYNWLVRRNKSVLDDVRAFGSDLHSVILASASKA
ncbi:MotA/TolQ/ExbB proton channel family protein [Zoogloea dura]|jgi:biopolymer transport protein ExbB|uniref:Biopolymer transport protein ExbB n=1 Tax=Zoogloea dura TaxID=2728840 RepID=A0A848GAY6_9RHOO|nr:MotA/TolQ/ExbB proton channel family protein [Zoogloea dura]NML27946.1 MotA/TolQ/ExbB proton channel family protein [Zoogloea dura]